MTDEINENTESIPDDIGDLDASEVLSTIMNDQDIRAVIDARREGKKVTVKRVDDDTPPKEEPVEDPYSGLSDEQRAIIGAIEKKLGPVFTDIEELKQIAGQYEKREVNTQIEQAKSKYSDFDQYRKSMAEISRQSPGLSLDDLYALAKVREGKLDVSPPSTDSERPTDHPRRTFVKKLSKMEQGIANPEASRGSRKREFQNSLADALDAALG